MNQTVFELTIVPLLKVIRNTMTKAPRSIKKRQNREETRTGKINVKEYNYLVEYRLATIEQREFAKQLALHSNDNGESALRYLVVCNRYATEDYEKYKVYY